MLVQASPPSSSACSVRSRCPASTPPGPSRQPHRRPPSLAVADGQATVLVAVVAPLSLAISAGALLIGDAIVPGGVAFSWEAVLGNTAYLTVVALLGLSLATVVRSTAMSIGVLVAVVFVLPPLLPLLPWTWVQTVADHFPDAAWQSLISSLRGASTGNDVAAVWTLAAWTLAPLTAGAILLTRRDA